MNGYLSVKQMAKRTGLTEERIRQLIRTHEIRRALKLGGWLVKTEDFEAFLENRIYEAEGPEPEEAGLLPHRKSNGQGNGQ